MALCGTCHRPVDWRELDGERVAFDTTPTMRGEERFSEGENGMVPVRPNADVLAYQRHTATCGKGHLV